jgi:hypothetical protein
MIKITTAPIAQVSFQSDMAPIANTSTKATKNITISFSPSRVAHRGGAGIWTVRVFGRATPAKRKPPPILTQLPVPIHKPSRLFTALGDFSLEQ